MTLFLQQKLGASPKYSGDALAVFVSENSTVRLRCAFQRLEGEVTSQGLWLASTAPGLANDRFRVTGDYLGRDGGAMAALPDCGTPEWMGEHARYSRPRLVEEYSVSVDGVEQDFLVSNPPAGTGPLRLELAVTGAQAEHTRTGATLSLTKSGRKLAYGRLRALDAAGRELAARMIAVGATRLVLLIDDSGAKYPVRIDPTFSDSNWSSVGGPNGGPVTVLALAADGLGNLYAAGSFTVIGNVMATNVAKWDGTSWSPLGGGISGGNPTSVNALAANDGMLYAGGSFTAAGGVPATNVAQWNGSTWSALGSGINGAVNALTMWHPLFGASQIYAGGSFTSAGGTTASNIASWDGSRWSSLGSGVNGTVNALLSSVNLSNLYVGGDFTNAGGTPADSIAAWDGVGWTNFEFGIDGVVYALAASNTTVYVGGAFSRAGEIDTINVAGWDGTNWLDMGGLEGSSGSTPGAVYALAAWGTNFLAGGSFTDGSFGVNYIAQWTGSGWGVNDNVPSTMNGFVHALALYGADVCAGGAFTTPGDAVAQNYGSYWSNLGPLPGTFVVGTMAVLGTNLYVGGTFTNMGGVPAANIARWDGSSWSALGAGINGSVGSLAVLGTNLYAGGFFNAAGDVQATNIAMWDGSAWSQVGSGLNVGVQVLAVSGTNLYAGGYFFMAGTVSANCVAKWDGSSWSALGSGMSDPDGAFVNALAVLGTNLYAGGRISTADGVPATNIAEWNGSKWSSVGSGLTGRYPTIVLGLAAAGSNLYAGGNFTNAGGLAANGIAEWNGTNWSALDSGVSSLDVSGEIGAMAFSGGDLYAGGFFIGAGGVAAANIAVWDGTNWSALGSGMNNGVAALVVSGSYLYAGGFFSTAGGKPANLIAQARIGSIANSIAAANTTANIGFFGVIGYQYDVQRAIDLVPPVVWTTLTTNSLSPASDGSFTFVDAHAPPGAAYYRSVQH
jgi:hypothetical protein